MYADIDNRGPAPGVGPPDLRTIDRRTGDGDAAIQVFGRWMMDSWNADINFMWGIQ